MKGTKLLMSYTSKLIGIGMTLVGVGLSIAEYATSFVVFKKFSPAIHLNFFLWFMLFGLFMIAFSKEKHEDERVKLIRSKAMMQAFLISSAAMMGFGFNVSLFPVFSPKDFIGATYSMDDYAAMGRILMFFPCFSIVSYLATFNFGLHFDQHWEYEDDISIKDNFKKNKKYIIIRILLTLVIFAIINYIINKL